MHYLSYVVIRQGHERPLDDQIEAVMGPWKEAYNEETEELSGIWDWFQIGGRWTGHFDGYDPEADPANVESCILCEGTGQRNDELGRQARLTDPNYSCNGCKGKGNRTAWPTQWKKHAGDVISLDTVPTDDEHTPHTLFVSAEDVLKKPEIYNHPGFPGWPSEKGLSESDGEQRKKDYKALDDRINKEHHTAVREKLAQLTGKGFSLVVIDYHC